MSKEEKKHVNDVYKKEKVELAKKFRSQGLNANKKVAKAIVSTFDGAIVSPYLMVQCFQLLLKMLANVLNFQLGVQSVQ
mgnify:CR=1 FL=1